MGRVMNQYELKASRAAAESLIVNPSFAVKVQPELFGRDKPLVSEARWIRANRRLLADIGADAYLRRLLQVLKGQDPAAKQKQLIEPDIEKLFGDT